MQKGKLGGNIPAYLPAISPKINCSSDAGDHQSGKSIRLSSLKLVHGITCNIKIR